MAIPRYVGWIPGLEIDRTFFHERFFLFQKIRTDSVNCADSRDTKILVQFPGNSILKFSTNFWKCVGGAWANPYQKLRNCIKLYLQQVEPIKLSKLFDFNLTHVKSNFYVVFNIELFPRRNVIGIKRCGIFLRIFLSKWKICRKMSTYPNAHANAKKWIFDIQYPGNRFEFGIISNDFWSSTIWAIQIEFPLQEFENP